MRLTVPQRDAHQRIVNLRHSILPADEIAAEIGSALRDAIGFDGYRMFAVEPTTGAIERLLAASEHDAAYRLLFLRDVYSGLQPEFFGPLGLNRPFRELPRCFAVGLSLDQCYGVAPERRLNGDARAYHFAYEQATDLYRARIDKADGMLHCIFNAGGRPVAVMHMYRITRWRGHLTASQVAFMSMLSPLIGEILAAVIQREVEQETGSAPEASGILIVDVQGQITYASPAASAWLETLGQTPTDRETGLPASLWSAVAGLRTLDATEGHAAGTGPVLRVGYRGGRARVESTPGAGPDQVAIVIAPEARTPADRVPMSPDLTAAETRVVRLVVDGLTNREIAQRLYLSENTVQWHLGHVYDKLGVRSRAQLVGRHQGAA
ncbi:MAG TPA: helix-turn-helix transcriptional regulator [Thermomicrobiales bacterium]|jgi:DNA-binding CsgD family transcriptional regulator/PAS domain-containing protein|nr:helix-turn-helix transcriptional regulator [Thermomicrobiales bacterium]